ncbi:reverse transcriptase domain-containing protein [Tanacetum coccineum]
MVATTEPRIIQSAILKAGVLNDKAVRNGSLKRSGERRGDDEESSKEGNVKGNNKRTRTGRVFAIITNPIRKEYTGSTPKCTKCNFHHNTETPCRACTNCNRLGHFARDCRARPRMVNPLNARNPTSARGAYSSEDSMGTHAERIILFGTILTTIPDTTPVITPPITQTDTTVIPIKIPIIAPTIPPSLDYTPASPDYSPASETEFDPSEDPSSDHIPLPKKIRSPDSMMDLEGCSEDSFEPYVLREVGLGVDVGDESSEQFRSRGTDIEVDDDVERSDEIDIDPVEAVIEACFDYADIIRASGVDVRVEAVTVARDDVETSARDPIIVSDDEDTPPVVPEVILKPAREGAAGSMYEKLGDLVQRFHDHTEAIPVHRIQVIEGVQREQGRRIIRVESAVTALTERIAELERDNNRLRGTASVKSQRVDQL